MLVVRGGHCPCHIQILQFLPGNRRGAFGQQLQTLLLGLLPPILFVPSPAPCQKRGEKQMCKELHRVSYGGHKTEAGSRNGGERMRNGAEQQSSPPFHPPSRQH